MADAQERDQDGDDLADLLGALDLQRTPSPNKCKSTIIHYLPRSMKCFSTDQCDYSIQNHSQRQKCRNHGFLVSKITISCRDVVDPTRLRSHAGPASQGVPGARVKGIPITTNIRSPTKQNWPYYTVTIGITPGVYSRWYLPFSLFIYSKSNSCRARVKEMTDGVRCQVAKGYKTEPEAYLAFTRAIMDNKVQARNPTLHPSALSQLRARTTTLNPTPIKPIPMSSTSSSNNPSLNRRTAPPHAWYLDRANANPLPERPRWIVLFQASDVGVFGGRDDLEHAAGAIANVRGAIWRIFDDVDEAFRAFDDGLEDRFVDVLSNPEWERSS